jgi:recombination DNA repair RAD52 pathway protein
MARRKKLKDIEKKEIEAIVNERFLEFKDLYPNFILEVGFDRIDSDYISVRLKEQFRNFSLQEKRIKEFTVMYTEALENFEFINNYFGFNGFSYLSFDITHSETNMSIFITAHFKCRYN